MNKKIKFLLLVILLTAVHSLQAQELSFKSLNGKWEGVDERNQKGSIRFVDSSTLIMSFMEGQEQKMSYSIDFSQHPEWLDMYINPDQRKVSLKCLIQMAGKDVIKLQVFPGEPRPDNFTSDSSTIIILKRVK